MSSSDEDIASDSDDAIENPIFEDESDESSDDDDGEEGNEDEEEDEEDQNDPEGALHRAALTKELWTACAEGDLARAEKAFVEGADPYRAYHTDVSRGDESWPAYPLFVAAERGHAHMVWVISNDRCRADWMDPKTKNTALHFAALGNHVEVLRILLDSHSPPPLDTGVDGSPLHMAAVRGRMEAAQFLLDRGANLEYQREGGQTPLFSAAFQGKTEMCRFLVQKGANPSVCDEMDEIPAFFAAVNGHLSTVKFFVEETSINLDHRNKAGFTIFDVANEHLMSETALYLWKHGVKSVRKRSKKVVEHQRVYMIHGPHIREYVSTIGVIGSTLYYVDSHKRTVSTADLSKIGPENLLELHDLLLPDATEVANRRLDPMRCGKLIRMTTPNQCVFLGKSNADANSIQGNWTVSYTHVSYYEVHILSGGVAPEVAVGYAWSQYDLNEDCPGWKPYSWGIHCDNGDFYWADGDKQAFSLRMGQGDTVGIGIIPSSGEIFVTCNGKFIGSPLRVPKKELFYNDIRPTIGMCAPDCLISVNFGQQPFKYDFMADCIRFSKPQAYEGVFPHQLGPGCLSLPQKTLYWLWDSIVSLNLETLKAQTHPIILPDNYDSRYKPTETTSALSCVIGSTMWTLVALAINEDETPTDFWQPFLRLWSFDLTTGEGKLHFLNTTHVTKPFPEVLPIDFWIWPADDKIYIVSDSTHCSFYIDTTAMKVVELLLEGLPSGIVEKHYVNQSLFTSSNEYEYPYNNILLSCMEDGQWAAPRCEGVPIPQRSNQRHCTHENKIIIAGGGAGTSGRAVDLSIVTVSDGETASALSFLLTDAGLSVADIRLQFPDNKTMRAHRVILRARSSKFRELLADVNTQELQISCQSVIFERVLEYMYTDAVKRDLDEMETRQLAAVLEEYLPEHTQRACEFLALSRVTKPSSMLSDMNFALHDYDSVDLQIAIEKVRFPAHRAVLVARSAFFRAMLLGNLKESNQSEIHLEDISSNVFEFVLEHIYTSDLGDSSSFEEEIVDVLIAASRFGVDDLTRTLEGIISQNLDDDNVESLLETAEMCGCQQLASACKRYQTSQKQRNFPVSGAMISQRIQN